MQWPYESLLFWASPADFGAHLVLIHDSWTIAYSPDKPFVIQPSIIPSSKKARKDKSRPNIIFPKRQLDFYLYSIESYH